MNKPDGNTAPSSASYLDALLAAAVDGVIIIDSAGIVLRINQAALQMFGYSEQEILGGNVSNLMPGVHADKHDGYLRKYIETGHAGIIGIGREVEALHKEQHLFPVYLSVGEIGHQDSPHFVGILRDLSAQQAVEEEMRVVEEQLTHAARLVTLGEMAAGIAHEINQPLTAIASFADAGSRLVKTGATSEEDLTDICHQISGQAHRAAEVVKRLREMVQPANSQRLPKNLNELVKSILLIADYNNKSRGVKIHLELDKELPEAFVDPVQVQQIILNLVNNAMEAFPDNWDQLKQVLIRTEQDGANIVLTVSDNGPGLAEGAESHLFEPFFTTKPNGIGLGLSISHSIAQRHGGRLSHRAGQLEGCCFRLTLPMTSVG